MYIYIFTPCTRCAAATVRYPQHLADKALCPSCKRAKERERVSGYKAKKIDAQTAAEAAAEAKAPRLNRDLPLSAYARRVRANPF